VSPRAPRELYRHDGCGDPRAEVRARVRAAEDAREPAELKEHEREHASPEGRCCVASSSAARSPRDDARALVYDASMSFKDHFSSSAALYKTARPRYPDALFDFIARAAPTTTRAWDAGCGNGQASHALAAHFAHVLATDPSTEQVSRAEPHERITFAVEPAERSSAADASVDVVTVAQALHWFDHARFFDEVRRVLARGGLLVAWGYSTFHVSRAFDAAFTTLVRDVVARDWPDENQLLWDGYRDIAFPGLPVEAPRFSIDVTWTLDALLAYVRTWSGVVRHDARTGRALVDEVRPALAHAWAEGSAADAPRPITMPIDLVARRF